MVILMNNKRCELKLLISNLLYSYKQILIDFLNFRIKLIKGEIYGGTKWI
jgi:hypothetical protein